MSKHFCMHPLISNHVILIHNRTSLHHIVNLYHRSFPGCHDFTVQPFLIRKINQTCIHKVFTHTFSYNCAGKRRTCSFPLCFSLSLLNNSKTIYTRGADKEAPSVDIHYILSRRAKKLCVSGTVITVSSLSPCL